MVKDKPETPSRPKKSNRVVMESDHVTISSRMDSLSKEIRGSVLNKDYS